MRHLDLFSGIGGFALAARWMGWETVHFVEIDKFCQKVLAKNFPNVPIHDDIKTFSGSHLRGTIDILTGGFPCQPYSSAGKRKGKEDDRHLWPEMLRVIRTVQPTYIVGENVYGLVNWSRGLVFDEVQTDLENAGYEVTPFILPACGVNAPHRRDRVWFVAYSSDARVESMRSERQNAIHGFKASSDSSRDGNNRRPTEVLGEVGRLERRKGEKKGQHTVDRNTWLEFPTQSPICGRNDGVSNRMDRVEALGNAVVPQVVYEIFKAIESVGA